MKDCPSEMNNNIQEEIFPSNSQLLRETDHLTRAAQGQHYCSAASQRGCQRRKEEIPPNVCRNIWKDSERA